MVVTLVARTGSRKTGIGRYTYSLYDTFHATERPVNLVPPIAPPLPGFIYDVAKKQGIDARRFFETYPIHIKMARSNICHLTSQNAATLLKVRRMPPTVLTILDLYWLIERRKGSRTAGMIETWFDNLSVAGMSKAREIITCSEYTRQTVIEQLDYPEERITTIPLAIDCSHFCPREEPEDFRPRYNLPPDAKIVLFVGSEDPRKNLQTLMRAFSLIIKYVPEALLVKGGTTHFQEEAKRLKRLAKELGIESRVRFVEDLPDEDLPYLYNTADVVVMPSYFEGFGLPAAEAMACGTPVIAADATSLPEVVGDTGVLFDPHSPDELADALQLLLEDDERRHIMAEQAIARAKQTFSLKRQADETWRIYRRVFEEAS